MVNRPLSIVAIIAALGCSQLAGFDDFQRGTLPDKVGGGSAFSGAPGADAGLSAFGGAPTEPGTGSASGRPSAMFGGNESTEPRVGGTGGGTVTPLGLSGGGTAGAGTAGAGTGGTLGGGTAGAGTGGTGARAHCDQELLANAKFDLGPVGWRENSTWIGITGVGDIIVAASHPKVQAAQITPQTGNYLAWFGGVPDLGDPYRVNLLQDVTIPAEVTRLVLTGQFRITTTEDQADEYDSMVLLLEDSESFWQFRSWTNLDASSDWRAFQAQLDTDQVVPLRGRTLTFLAESRTDLTFVTNFWLDSLSLIGECGR